MADSDLDPDELADLFMRDDSDWREQRTLRHEAGHATVAWLIRQDLKQPPFEYVEVGTMGEHAGGVVPGGVKFDVAWFDALPPVERGAILLAGIYVQDADEPYDAEEWREMLDALDGADGANDYARAIAVAKEAGLRQAEFDECVRARLAALKDLHLLLDVVSSTLRPGERTPGDAIVEAVQARVAKASGAPGS